jgi:glycosyltransferase involved in cell wall biosynthesis
VEKTVGIDPRKTVVIPNAVDGERFMNAIPADLTPYGIPAGSRVLITIGRLEHQKGGDVLLAAIPAVAARFPDVHWLLVGDGPDRGKLAAQAQSLGIADRVHFAGFRKDIPERLRASTALVLPSRWEGMPNVVLEALAAGKPIVASEVEGVTELVRPGINGWLVRPEQPQILGETMARLLDDPDAVSRMGRESQSIYEKEFTIDRFVETHVQLFQQMIDSSHS